VRGGSISKSSRAVTPKFPQVWPKNVPALPILRKYT
jgi:hypothetical protein